MEGMKEKGKDKGETGEEEEKAEREEARRERKERGMGTGKTIINN